jgi:hypothetical protein
MKKLYLSIAGITAISLGIGKVILSSDHENKVSTSIGTGTQDLGVSSEALSIGKAPLPKSNIETTVSKKPEVDRMERPDRDTTTTTVDSASGNDIQTPGAESASALSEEDKAVLALSDQVEEPVPLGPEYEDLSPPDDETAQLIELHNALYGSQGDLKAEAQHLPVGPMHINSYRVEEVTLPQPTSVKVKGEESVANSAWRVTVGGGPFPVGALPIVLWINNNKVGYAQPNLDLSKVTAVTFDRDLLRDGATFAVSYGENGAKTKLPEKLSFSTQP